MYNNGTLRMQCNIHKHRVSVLHATINALPAIYVWFCFVVVILHLSYTVYGKVTYYVDVYIFTVLIVISYVQRNMQLQVNT